LTRKRKRTRQAKGERCSGCLRTNYADGRPIVIQQKTRNHCTTCTSFTYRWASKVYHEGIEVLQTFITHKVEVAQTRVSEICDAGVIDEAVEVTTVRIDRLMRRQKRRKRRTA
jgi:hypothetical protein